MQERIFRFCCIVLQVLHTLVEHSVERGAREQTQSVNSGSPCANDGAKFLQLRDHHHYSVAIEAHYKLGVHPLPINGQSCSWNDNSSTLVVFVVTVAEKVVMTLLLDVKRKITRRWYTSTTRAKCLHRTGCATETFCCSCILYQSTLVVQ